MDEILQFHGGPLLHWHARGSTRPRLAHSSYTTPRPRSMRLRTPLRHRRTRGWPLVCAVAVAVGAQAQVQAPPDPVTLDPVVVTATKRAERSFDVPASVDSIDGSIIRDGQPAINLSEPLVRVPGIFAANRNNYAQDLQISSRGFLYEPYKSARNMCR